MTEEKEKPEYVLEKWGMKIPVTRMTVGPPWLSESWDVGNLGEYVLPGPRASKVMQMWDSRLVPAVASHGVERVRTGFDCIWLITGERRTGKSTLAAQMALSVDPDFSVDNIAFRLDDFNDVIESNPWADPEKGIYPQVILDEAGFDLFSQNWMKEVQRNLVRKMEVIGAKRQIVYLCLPHRMMLNRQLREGFSPYWINTQVERGERGLAIMREGHPNVFDIERYWSPEAVFLFDRMTGTFWEKYSEKKNVFIEWATGDQYGDGAPDKSKLRVHRDRLIVELYNTGKFNQQQLAKLLDCSQGMISGIIKGKS